MKKSLSFLFIVISFIQFARAQTIQVFPDPEQGFGYLTNSVSYNNKLYTPYRNASFVTVLAQFDGNATTLLPNPDAGSSAAIDYMLVYGAYLTFRYQNASGVSQLAVFDGTTTKLIPNPDNSIVGYMGSPVVYNNKLYFEYVNASGSFQLAQYDGVSVTLITNPTNGINTGMIGYPIVYNGNLYFEYLSTASSFLAKFDGTAITLIPNVAGGKYTDIVPSDQGPVPIIYHGKLYFNYLYKKAYCLAVYDGTGITVIPNPDFDANNVTGYTNSPVIYNDTLYVEYQNAGGIYQLAKFDGSALKLIANPDAGQLNPYGSYPILYHCDIYFSYLNGATIFQLARFNGSTLSLVPNPPSSPGIFEGYTAPAVLYANKLFFNYNSQSPGINQLAEYSDLNNAVTPIPNPAGESQSDGPDLAYNGKLCTQYFNGTGVEMAELDSATDTIGIPKIMITASNDTICAGTPVTFTAHPVNYGLPSSYQWLLNGKRVGTDTIVYTNSTLQNGDTVRCVMTYSNDCYTDSVISNNIIIVLQAGIVPSVSIDSSAGNVCGTNPITFTATPVNGGANPAYQWQLNGVNTGTNSASYTDNTPVIGDIVNCIMTSDAGCVTNAIAYSDSITIVYKPPVSSSIIITADKNNFCYGDTASFTAAITNGGTAPDYQWKINGTDAGGNSAIFSTDSLPNGSTVSCTLSDSVGCVLPSSDSITMTVFPLPTVTNVDTIIKLGTNIILNLPVTGNIQSYEWTPGAGLSNPNTQNPSITPEMNSVFTLQVTTADGCIDSGTYTVNVFSAFYMPNAFTPNNDGRNDIFRIPPSISVKIKEFIVYDRIGKKLFYTTNAAQGWDGTYGGQQQSNGTYVWVIEYYDPITNQPESINGTVVLIR
jgi:gliding motility-associated-like protein